MSGLGLVLSIAKDALAAQRYGMDVTAHNIANVNTPGYSRQSLVHEAREPAPYGGVFLGRGVNTTQILRVSDQFIENQLMQQHSSMLSSKEMENYMQVLEGFFNENSETSISAMLAKFWNFWHDIANNPSGSSERIALYQHSVQLSEQFNAMNSDLTKIQGNLTNALKAGIDDINQITSEIAQLNNEIVRIEASSNANDFRDKRNALVSELSEYLNVKSFEQDNGSITVVTARGCILVHVDNSYCLELGGDTGDRVEWRGSGDTTTDITDYITNGKLGGWLDVRDEVIAKYKLDLDAMAKEFIWAVNQQHSQGVGLEAFSTVSGTYAATQGDAIPITASGLSYQSEIDDNDKTFKIWRYDSNGEIYGGGAVTITLTPDETIDSLVTEINSTDGLTAQFDADSNKVTIAIDTAVISGGSFAFAEDTSNVLAALGINTYFQGSGAESIAVNAIVNDKDYIAAAQINSSGNYVSGDNTNALAIVDLKYESRPIKQYTCVRGEDDTYENVTATLEDYYHSTVGSIGIKSASISRSNAFNEVMVNKLSEIRDSISAVSLDEEMTNLIKFQHAYTAAAKLISVSDEMLNILLSVK